jgi:hypothetical protein
MILSRSLPNIRKQIISSKSAPGLLSTTRLLALALALALALPSTKLHPRHWVRRHGHRETPATRIHGI